MSVLGIHDRVEKRGQDPKTVANTLDLDVADVHRALAYYYENRGRMTALEDERDRIREVADGTGNGPVEIE